MVVWIDYALQVAKILINLDCCKNGVSELMKRRNQKDLRKLTIGVLKEKGKQNKSYVSDKSSPL